MATKVKLKDTAGQQVYPEIDATDKGTVVVANPSDIGTADLSKIKINNTIYNIGGGGGGGQTPLMIPYTLQESEEGPFPIPTEETPTRNEVYEAYITGRICMFYDADSGHRNMVIEVSANEDYIQIDSGTTMSSEGLETTGAPDGKVFSENL